MFSLWSCLNLKKIGILKKKNNNNFPKNSKSKKGHNSCKNEFKLFFVHIPFFRVNVYFELQVYIMFSKGRGRTKCQFLHDNDDDDDNGNA